MDNLPVKKINQKQALLKEIRTESYKEPVKPVSLFQHLFTFVILFLIFILSWKFLIFIYNEIIEPLLPNKKETNKNSEKAHKKEKINTQKNNSPIQGEKVEIEDENVHDSSILSEVDEADDNFKPKNLEEILIKCGFYCEKIVKKNVYRDGSSSPSSTVEKKIKVFPKISFYPKKDKIKNEILFDMSLDSTSVNEANFNQNPNFKNLSYFGELLYQSKIITQPQLFITNTNRAGVYKISVVTEEIKKKRNFEDILRRVHFYSKGLNKGDNDIFPNHTFLPDGTLKLHIEGIPVEPIKIIPAIPMIEKVFNTNYDHTQIETPDDKTVLIKKVVPVVRFLSATEEIEFDEHGQPVVKIKNPQTVIDKFDEFKSFLDYQKNLFNTDFTPYHFIGETLVATTLLKDKKFLLIPMKTNAHQLVLGTTGSGKSKTLIMMLIYQKYVNNATILMHDNKSAVESDIICRYLSDYELSTFNEQDISKTEFHSQYCQIQMAYQEILRRAKMCREIKASDYVDYNKKKSKAILTPYIVVMEEWGTKASNFQAEGSLTSPPPGSPQAMMMHILKTGRSYGVIIIIATQDAKAVELPMVLKGLMGTRLVHKMANASDGLYMDVPARISITSLKPGEYIIKSSEIEVSDLRAGGILMADTGEGLETLLKRLNFIDKKEAGILKQFDDNEVFITGSGDGKGEKKKKDHKTICRLTKKFMVNSNFEVVNYRDDGKSNDAIFLVGKSNNPNFKGNLAIGILNANYHKLKHITQNYKNYPDTSFIYINPNKKMDKSIEKEISLFSSEPENSKIQLGTIFLSMDEISFLLDLCVADNETFSTKEVSNSDENKTYEIEILDDNRETLFIQKINEYFGEQLEQYNESMEDYQIEKQKEEVSDFIKKISKANYKITPEDCEYIIIQHEKGTEISIPETHREVVLAYYANRKKQSIPVREKQAIDISIDEDDIEEPTDDLDNEESMEDDAFNDPELDEEIKQFIKENNTVDDSNEEDDDSLPPLPENMDNEEIDTQENDNELDNEETDNKETIIEEININESKSILKSSIQEPAQETTEKPKRLVFTKEQKIAILKEQQEHNLSNNQLEKKYNLSKGLIGKWKKENNIE